MKNIEKIKDYVKSGINDGKRLGLELEHLVYDENYNIIPYDDMVECLEKFAKLTGGELYREGGVVTGMICADYSLSLEPGCQLEISIIPKENIADIVAIYNEFRALADKLIGEKGYMLFEQALLPFVENGSVAIEDVPIIPKKRYAIMNKHFESTGKYGKYMMRASASTQISLDYSSEENAIKKMRVLQKIAPIVAMLTETRNAGDKKIFEKYLVRSQIWQSVDNARCGYIDGSLSKDFSFEKYAQYIYNNEALLIKENDDVYATPNQMINEIYEDKSLDNVDYLISMYFPAVRLKKYIEFRVADSMPIKRAVSYMEFIKTIAYNEEALDKLDELFANVTDTKQIIDAEKALFKAGFDAEIYGENALLLTEKVFDIVLSYAENKAAVKELIPVLLLNKEYYDIIEGNEAIHEAECLGIKDYLNQSTAKYHNRVVRTLYIPKMFSNKEIDIMKNDVKILFGIFDKAIKEYQQNPEYRKLFGFSKELEELIMLEPRYSRNIPMARVDIFMDEKTGDYKFCEFNTDGASAMNEDRELNIAFSQSKAFKEFAKNHNVATFELFDSWVKEAIEIYHDYTGDKNAIPNVLITDFMESATTNEFYIFKDAFEKQGCKTTICDIRNVRFENDTCFAEDGTKIDLIYRRAVTSDIMRHLDEVEPFLNCVKAGKVCLLGDFRTQIAHNKILYKILHSKATSRILTEVEKDYVKNHIPFTMDINEVFENPEILEDVLTNKNKWIIKPEDSYGSKGVLAGVELEDLEKWKQTIMDAKGEKFIVQEFCTPYRLRNIGFQDDGFGWTDTSNLTGIFVYNGKFSGIYSRVSYDQMISTQYNEMSLPTILVKK